jgi:DNA-directed RNA polymerase specialized sigma24 family protein
MYAANTAIAGLYQAYSRELHAFARRRAGRQEAEDIVQDAYLHLLQRGTAGTLEHPRSYRYRTAANLAVNLAQSKSPAAPFAGGKPIFLQRRRSAKPGGCGGERARIATP